MPQSYIRVVLERTEWGPIVVGAYTTEARARNAIVGRPDYPYGEKRYYYTNVALNQPLDSYAPEEGQ